MPEKSVLLSIALDELSSHGSLSIEEFDFEFNPDIDKAKILELASLQFLENKQIALFLGKPGTGKTHLALAIGIKAVEELVPFSVEKLKVGI